MLMTHVLNQVMCQIGTEFHQQLLISREAHNMQKVGWTASTHHILEILKKFYKSFQALLASANRKEYIEASPWMATHMHSCTHARTHHIQFQFVVRNIILKYIWLPSVRKLMFTQPQNHINSTVYLLNH